MKEEQGTAYHSSIIHSGTKQVTVLMNESFNPPVKRFVKSGNRQIQEIDKLLYFYMSHQIIHSTE